MAVQHYVAQTHCEAWGNKHHPYTVEGDCGTGVVRWYPENAWMHLAPCVALGRSSAPSVPYPGPSSDFSPVLGSEG